ncbi:ABC transporter ATP-binding protein/permease [Geodermatophilus sp. YIM 151500]|uniref:ABC transporter ATP-binding protein n=1 Tax=Geodermatophilus sp. YIM 151500 TaxID=2984531 RepID=UPI0021E46776|nr:ABC transporter ATP-binding protein [Geodermatophilus sp. YIM 151500]MCV2490720.1 ABC transporter ATP-binding protein/permease [Geodermatophilus sp. YIM 151500]
MPARPPWASGLRGFRGLLAVWRQLRPFLGASPRQLALLAGGAVVAGLVEAALLALVAVLAGALSQGASEAAITPGPLDLRVALPTLIAVGVALAVGRAVLQVWLAYLPARLGARAMADLRLRLFDGFTRTAWPVQAAERDGAFQTLMGTNVSYASMAVTRLASGITAVLMFATLLASAFVLSVWTALVLIAASTLLFLLLAPLSHRLRRHTDELAGENVEYGKGVHEVVQMAEEIQVFGASAAYRQEVDRLVQRVRRPLFRVRFLLRAVPQLYQSVALLLLVLALAFVHLSGTSEIAVLGAVVLILVRSLTFGQHIQASWLGLVELVPYAEQLRRALDEYTSRPQPDGDRPLARVEWVRMHEIHYAYTPGDDVLRGVSFTARRGETIGIVGPSGAGKSTLVQLLLRLRAPTAGEFEVNGEDAASIRRADWLRRVSYVPQTSQLIWGTVTDNIRFYRPEITDAEVVEAARRAHIHDEIASWPQGYDTLVGQRVAAVSGGQRQRLCLARALAGSPDVLVLDEPTSALDVRSELAVQQSLEELKHDVLLFLVAHRLSTLSVCDRVMVVVDGRLQAMDVPAALLEHNDFYREVTEITRRQGAL